MTSRTGGIGLFLVLAACAALLNPGLKAQDKDAKPGDKPPEPAASTPKEESSVTEHSITVAGHAIPYKTTAATILLKNEKDEPTALFFPCP